MKHEADVKDLLISNAIHLISEGGFEKATTKELTHCGGSITDIKMNEVYIYRLFGSKEQLFADAFYRVEHAMHYAFYRAVEGNMDPHTGTSEHLFDLFSQMWRFLLDHEEFCRYYMCFYYSSYFRGRPCEAHMQLFEKSVKMLNPFLSMRAGDEILLHSVWITMLECTLRVHNGETEDYEEGRQHIFMMLYAMATSALKNPRTASIPLATG